jgi:hypothetical protein
MTDQVSDFHYHGYRPIVLDDHAGIDDEDTPSMPSLKDDSSSDEEEEEDKEELFAELAGLEDLTAAEPAAQTDPDSDDTNSNASARDQVDFREEEEAALEAELAVEEAENITETCTVVYAAPSNKLTRVKGCLAPMDNISQDVEQQLLLDCGCTTSLLGQKTAEKMKTGLKDASNIILYITSGEEMKVAGQSEI